MQKRVPGMDVPMRLSSVWAGSPRKAVGRSLKLAVEQIEELKTIPGIRGFHIMASNGRKRWRESWNRPASIPGPSFKRRPGGQNIWR